MRRRLTHERSFNTARTHAPFNTTDAMLFSNSSIAPVVLKSVACLSNSSIAPVVLKSVACQSC